MVYKNRNKDFLFGNMLKNLKSDLSLIGNLDLEEIAIYIIQIEIIKYLQKHNIFALGSIFDNLFQGKSKKAKCAYQRSKKYC